MGPELICPNITMCVNVLFDEILAVRRVRYRLKQSEDISKDIDVNDL